MICKLVNDSFKENYLENLLHARGVSDINSFLLPDAKMLNSPFNFDNIDQAIELYLNALSAKKPIYLIVDSDCDGFTSSAIIYKYTKALTQGDCEIRYILHNGKQHGLEDCIDNLIGLEDIGLIICPDSSSNDFEYHEQLKDTCPVLVLDHHEAEPPFSGNAVIVNNQLSANYPNKDLTGAGVAYQFCRAVDLKTNNHFAEDLIDLAALGICGDMGSVIEPENRYFLYYGFRRVKNEMFKALADKQSFSMGGKINPMTVAFYIVPLINAMIRVGTQSEKERLFIGFIDGNKMIPSGKRGANGAMEFACIESARECTNAKAKQGRIQDSAVEQMEIKIFKNDLLKNKVLFLELDEDDDFPAELNGLIAMKLAAKYKHPTIVARLNNEGYIRGSARGLNGSELEDFKAFLTDSNYFEYAQGHANAFGVSIPEKNLFAFHEYANEALKDYDFDENVYEVNFERIAADKDLSSLVYELGANEDIWGQFNPEVKIHITNINISYNDIQIMGKNNDTVKFTKFGLTYIKFHAKEFIKELQQYPEMTIEIVGKPNLNEWCGTFTSQIFVEDYEIRKDLGF